MDLTLTSWYSGYYSIPTASFPGQVMQGVRKEPCSVAGDWYCEVMDAVQEIETAIEQLPSDQRWDLLHRLQDRLWEDWDRQIETDHKAGRLNALLAEAESDIAAGRVRPLDEVIGHQ